MNRPTRCRSRHVHGSPSTALACDAARWQDRMVNVLGLDPADAARQVHAWHVGELAKIRAGEEIARARGR